LELSPLPKAHAFSSTPEGEAGQKILKLHEKEKRRGSCRECACTGLVCVLGFVFLLSGKDVIVEQSENVETRTQHTESTIEASFDVCFFFFWNTERASKITTKKGERLAAPVSSHSAWDRTETKEIEKEIRWNHNEENKRVRKQSGRKTLNHQLLRRRSRVKNDGEGLPAHARNEQQRTFKGQQKKGKKIKKEKEVLQ
jgi:hypothetical protein